jgi:hypothetical protein
VRRAREAETFQLDAGTCGSRPASRGAEMVKSVECRLLRQGNTADSARQVSALRDEIAHAQQIVEAYRDRTGRAPAPILTREQRDYLRDHQDVIRDQGGREEFREGLDRAVVVG